MKWKNLFLVALLAPVLNSCLKSADNLGNSNEKRFITQARDFFDKFTAEKGNIIVDYKSGSPRTVLWDQANVFQAANGYALTAPLEYKLPLFVKSDFTSNSIFHLNDLSQLLLYGDSNGQFHLEVLTKFPDTTYLKDPGPLRLS